MKKLLILLLLPITIFSQENHFDTTIARLINEKINEYQALTSQELEKFYSNIDEITTVKSFTFDDSDVRDSAGGSTPDFSLDLETMDNEQFDSSFNS